AQIELGDAWWERANPETGRAKQHLRERAKYWYDQAVTKVTGITRDKIKERLAEIDKDPVVAPRTARPLHPPPTKLTYLYDLNYSALRSGAPANNYKQGGVTVNGKRHTKTLWLLAPVGGAAQVTYRIGGQYAS